LCPEAFDDKKIHYKKRILVYVFSMIEIRNQFIKIYGEKLNLFVYSLKSWIIDETGPNF
jgi:hypothetical protein